MTVRLTREEMETHLYWSEEVDSIATIVTFNNRLKKKLQTAAEQFGVVKIISEDPYGELVAELPKGLISLNIKTPKEFKKKREMTEEQKQAFVERVHGKKN